MTPLDHAMQAVRSKKAKPEEFYNLFLSTQLCIPTWNIPDKVESKRAGENETFAPVIVENDGKKYMLLFDTEERLVEWAKREIGVVELPGYALVELQGLNVQWVLNPGSEFMHEFVLDEIAWLRSYVQSLKPATLNMSAESAAQISAPSEVSAEILQALTAVISRNVEITQAFLAELKDPASNEAPRLALLLRSTTDAKGTREVIAQEVGLFLNGKLGEGQYIDILFDNGHGLAREISSKLPPFFKR